MSRQHQSRIINTAGGEVSLQKISTPPWGSRVRYELGFDRMDIEALAINVRRVDDPVAMIED